MTDRERDAMWFWSAGLVVAVIFAVCVWAIDRTGPVVSFCEDQVSMQYDNPQFLTSTDDGSGAADGTFKVANAETGETNTMRYNCETSGTDGDRTLDTLDVGYVS